MTKCYMWKILSSQKDSPGTNNGHQHGSSIPAQNRKPIVSTYFPRTHEKKKKPIPLMIAPKIIKYSEKNSRKEESLYTRNSKTLRREFKDL